MELYEEKLLQASRITKGTRKTNFCFCNGERATDRSAMAFCSSTYISIDFLSIEAYRSEGVVRLEAFLEHGGLVLGQAQLLARGAVVVLVAADGAGAGRPLRRGTFSTTSAAARHRAAGGRAPPLPLLRRGRARLPLGGGGIAGVAEAGLQRRQA